MKTIFVFQSSNLPEKDIRLLMEGIKANNVDWHEFGVIPFTNELTNFDDESADKILSADQVVMHSGIKLLSLPRTASNEYVAKVFPLITDIRKAQELYQKIMSGIFYTTPERFDQSTYTNLPIRDYMLNGNCEVVAFNDALLKRYFEEAFVKPGSDRKFFTAGVIQNMTLEQYLSGTMYQTGVMDGQQSFNVIIAPVERTLIEWRFYVINGKIATQSQYFKLGNVKHEPFVPEEAINVANEYVKLFSPQENPTHFVMDIALLPNKTFKIVEYNCFNCSGLYSCDITAYVRAFL